MNAEEGRSTDIVLASGDRQKNGRGGHTGRIVEGEGCVSDIVEEVCVFRGSGLVILSMDVDI